jgi:hypothetical protein
MDTLIQSALTESAESDAWCETLFFSALQPSDTPTAEAIARAIGSVRRAGLPRSGGARVR